MFTTLQVNSYINGGILYIQLYYAAFNYEIPRFSFSKVSHFVWLNSLQDVFRRILHMFLLRPLILDMFTSGTKQG